MDIPKIDEWECSQLRFKKEHKRATRLAKLQIDRYYFDSDVNNQNLTDEGRSRLFYEYVSKTVNMKYFRNLKAEINKSTDQGLRGDATNETLNTLPIRLSYILKLNELLGIPNTGTTDIVIQRKTIESTNEYLQNEYKTIISAFQFGSKITKLWDTSHSIDLIKQIYKSWNRCEFVAQKDSHRKVLSITMFQCNYFLLFPFIPIIDENIVTPPSIVEVEETRTYLNENLQMYIENYTEEEEDKDMQRINCEDTKRKQEIDVANRIAKEHKDKKFKRKHHNQCLITSFLE